MYYVQAPEPVSEKGWKWKPKGKTFSKFQSALDFKVKTQSDVKSGSHAEPSDLTVGEIAREWIEAGKPDWKIQTQNGHATQVEKYIVPALGHLKAQKLSHLAIRAASVDWQNKLGAKTVNNLLANHQPNLRVRNPGARLQV
jgi:hypothetical protein